MFRVFDDPHGDPFFTYVEMDGKWLRIDEATVIEQEERIMREVGEHMLARLERRFSLGRPKGYVV